MTELTAIRIRLRHRKGCGEISTAFLSLIYHIQICRFHDVHAFSVAMSLAILMQLCCQNFWAKSRLFDRLENGFEKPFDRHLTDIKNWKFQRLQKVMKKAAFPKKSCFSLAAEEGFEPSQTESELPEYVNYGVFPCVFWLC